MRMSLLTIEPVKLKDTTHPLNPIISPLGKNQFIDYSGKRRLTSNPEYWPHDDFVKCLGPNYVQWIEIKSH